MTTLRKNVIANYAGKAWAALINIAFVPFYIKYMGIEAYGLVGIFATIQPLMTILDLGMSPSINRELARYSASPGQEQVMRNLVRTLEVVYWGLAAVLCVIVLLFSSVVASNWVIAQALPFETVRQSVLLMGLSIVFQWPVGFYTGGLMGLQRQMLFNLINTIIWTLRGVGALVVVMVSPAPVLGFFWWQFFMSVVNVAAVAVALWRLLPLSRTASQFQSELIVSVWRLAIGMSAVSVVVLVFNQLDKIILSQQISLTDFGYYSLAWQVVGSLFMLYYPIYSAFFPLMTQLISQGDLDTLVGVYHKGCQFMSSVVLPATVVLVFFSKDILLLWVRDPVTVERSAYIMSILLVGAAFNGMLCMQYGLNLAFGKTKHMLYIYLVSVLAYIPTLTIVSHNYGVYGSAMTFSIFSLGQYYIIVRNTHREFMPEEHRAWVRTDLGKPLLVSFITCLIVKNLIFWHLAGVTGVITILASYLITLFATMMITPNMKRLVKRYMSV